MPISPTNGAHSGPPAIPEPGLGFNGQLTERGGWQLLGNGYRAYNPALMRFHSPDTASPFGDGGLNAYGYCAGDPVNRVDPTGHFAWMAAVRTLIASGRSMAAWVAPVRAALRRPIPVSLLKNSAGVPFRPTVMTPELLGHLEQKMHFQRSVLTSVEGYDQMLKARNQIASRTFSRPRWKELSSQFRQERREYRELLKPARNDYLQAKEVFRYAQPRTGQRIISPESAAHLTSWAGEAHVLPTYATWARQRNLQQLLKRPVDPDGMLDMVASVRQS